LRRTLDQIGESLSTLMAEVGDDPVLGISLEAQTCPLEALLDDASTRMALQESEDLLPLQRPDLVSHPRRTLSQWQQ